MMPKNVTHKLYESKAIIHVYVKLRIIGRCHFFLGATRIFYFTFFLVFFHSLAIVILKIKGPKTFCELGFPRIIIVDVFSGTLFAIRIFFLFRNPRNFGQEFSYPLHHLSDLASTVTSTYLVFRVLWFVATIFPVIEIWKIFWGFC